MSTKFIKRDSNVVTIRDDSTLLTKDVKFPTPEQAELYELILTDKVFFKSLDFARNLVLVKNPTTHANGQLFWIKKLVDDTNRYHTKTALSPSPVTQTVDITKVLDMFHNARQHLKHPKITLMMGLGPNNEILPTTQKVRFSLREDYGRLYMNGEGYGINYGWIEITTHKLVLRHYGLKREQDLKKLLDEFTKEPQKTAILHGKLTGNCCFCSLPLSDDRSLHMGYGPICADHWHLPWGDKPVVGSTIEWVAGDKVA